MRKADQSKRNRNQNTRFGKIDGKRTVGKRWELKDYIYYAGSNKQASNYESTTEFIINYIKGDFNYGNDIAESLRNLEWTSIELWYPTLEMSSTTNNVINITETKQFELKYKAKLDAMVKREEIFNNNKTKAYSVI